ncbi:MAG: glycosyltransferase [Gammaproteobacteria bacterium]|nr:glycosyltransferase [Gammaproteobacteria bacterium]MDH3412361.1 glycosyltransferase [Gammaproteobacteria bacterium]
MDTRIDGARLGGAVAIVLKGYPRLSETFIAQEIRGIEQRGVDLRIFSLRRPTDRARHPVHEEIRAPVAYLPEYLYREPLRVLRGLVTARSRPGFGAAARVWLKDLIRDPTPNRIRRFGQALVLARELPEEVAHLHAHFLHTPASVARYAALLLGLPWSCSAHAKDIWTTPVWEKREKLASCAWAVTCTRCNQEHLSRLGPGGERVELVYHGLDLERFPAPNIERKARDGTSPEQRVKLLCVGRAVEKKGLDDLLASLARLPSALHWELHHVGGGVELERLRRLTRRLGLAPRVHWHGPLGQVDVLRHYAAADLFVLASRVARNGDRDGLPNVLMEAQSQRLACVATRVSGIPELIEEEETGLLVPPRDVDALANAIARLIVNPELRALIAAAGQRRVREAFSFASGVDRLASRLRPEANVAPETARSCAPA